MKAAGGPAFPGYFPASDDQEEYCFTGMTLRDWFAGQALAGPLAASVAKYDAQEFAQLGGHTWMAAVAFNIADAMLKAREARS